THQTHLYDTLTHLADHGLTIITTTTDTTHTPTNTTLIPLTRPPRHRSPVTARARELRLRLRGLFTTRPCAGRHTKQRKGRT
ncbi:hypothetical protein, partial [Nocardiopsis rhodophaea]